MNQRLIALCPPDSPDKAHLQREVAEACRYARLDVSFIEPFDLPTARDLESVFVILVLPGSLPALPGDSWNRLRRYVHSGGGMVAVTPEPTPAAAAFWGVVQQDAHWPEADGAPSVEFTYDLVPEMDGLKVSAELFAPAYPVRLDETTCTLIARHASGCPIAWRRTEGHGSIIVWNTDVAHDRTKRGLLTQSLLAVRPLSVQPIVHAASMHIDDYPSGYSDREVPLLKNEFGLTFLEFLNRVWLPDMLKLAASADLTYTFTVLFNYHDRTEPPPVFAEWEAHDDPARFARRVNDRHELSLHGYNHVPLLASAWASRANMEHGLSAAMHRWVHDDMGPLPTSYVPPMNEYDQTGCAALTHTFPSMRVICGSYWGDPRHGGSREYGPEPWNPALFCLPRHTSGYLAGDAEMFLTLSQLAMLGVWTHFVHPDDIIDTEHEEGAAYVPRNARRLGWRSGENGSLFTALRDWVDRVRRLYPRLAFVGATELAARVRAFLDNRVRIEFTDHDLAVAADVPTVFQLRLRRPPPRRLAKLHQVELLHSHRGSDYDLHTLSMTGTSCRITLETDR